MMMILFMGFSGRSRFWRCLLHMTQKMSEVTPMTTTTTRTEIPAMKPWS
jgi:hypothetical protein